MARLLHLQKNVYQGETTDCPPLPKLEEPALYLGAHGEVFNYATLEKGPLVFTMGEVNIPPGKGPPAHMHHFVSEFFYAPEGGITLWAADTDYLDLENPPNAQEGTQVTVYLIPLKPGQIFCSPRHRIHGYVNADPIDRPLTCFWKPYPDAPHFPKYNDGGTREFFESVHHKITNTDDMSSVTEKRRAHYIAESPKFALPHSSYLLQFINRVIPEIPDTLQHQENFPELNEMMDLVKEYNAGSQEIICH